MSLYGTRDAAANFQAEVRKEMKKAGFVVNLYNPSTYYHPQKDLKTLVHGDDFVTSGRRRDMQWFQDVLKKRFEISTIIIGTRSGEVKEAKILNRVIRVDEEGWNYEADQRHAELIIKAMNLEGAKGVSSPGEDEKPWKEEELKELLSSHEATKYRAVAARANYLALDRPDIQFATKEVCRGMSSPTRGDVSKLRRLARYLILKPRSVMKYRFQSLCMELSGYSDSDWAGCRRTAKSTSGGAVMRGSHCLKTWASTQKNITLSSGEAELVAVVKMSSELIGLLQLAHEWGMEMDGHVYTDSSAALGVVKRKGNGKLRHIRVGMLWIQEKRESEELRFRKVAGTENPGDMMTKNVPPKVAEKLQDLIGQTFEAGRSSVSLTV